MKYELNLIEQPINHYQDWGVIATLSIREEDESRVVKEVKWQDNNISDLSDEKMTALEKMGFTRQQIWDCEIVEQDSGKSDGYHWVSATVMPRFCQAGKSKEIEKNG